MEEVHEARKGACEEAVKLLSTGMTPQPTLIILNKLIELSDLPSIVEFCERAEDATMSSPFVDHLAVFSQLDIIYDKIYFEKKASRKIAFKKFRVLEEDKKTEPAVLEESRKVKDDIDLQCAKISMKSVEVKLIIGSPEAGAPKSTNINPSRLKGGGLRWKKKTRVLSQPAHVQDQ